MTHGPIRVPGSELLTGVIHQPLKPLLEISRLNGTPWVNPGYDTSNPNWSSNVVGGKTFDGSTQHKYEWVSVLNPTEEQDDEVGVAGVVVHPDDSGADLPFTHPFGGDFEFGVVPDPAYDGLLAPDNKDPNSNTYADYWKSAQAAGIAIPTGLLGLEVDGELVPPDYRPVAGDRVALYGRWIVDAGHKPFHAEIHPPLLMGFARSVDDNDRPAPRSASATTLFRLWSRPYQAGQLFTDGGSTGLCLQDYLSNIAETTGDIRAYPPIFAKPFDGVHLVAFTIRPPVPPPSTPEATLQLECSYHFTVNGASAVEVIPSPADAHSLLVVVSLNAVGYPKLPDPPSSYDTYSIPDLLKQAPSGVDLSWLQQLWLSIHGVIDNSSVYVRRFHAPNVSPTQDSVNVAPFTPISAISTAAGHATDNSQPFPIYGWVKLRWVQPRLVATGDVTRATGVVERAGTS